MEPNQTITLSVVGAAGPDARRRCAVSEFESFVSLNESFLQEFSDGGGVNERAFSRAFSRRRCSFRLEIVSVVFSTHVHA
jgi:hypothetical protein